MAQTNKKFWAIKDATDGAPYELDLFGEVGSGFWSQGFDENSFLEDFRRIPKDAALKISINSFGGSVFAALSIYSILKSHAGKLTFRVDGVAMSAATLITSVPNAKVIMPTGSMLMIHKPWCGAEGNSDDLTKVVEDLEKIEQTMLDIYEAKSGRDRAEIAEKLTAETFFSAAEAVEFGLADEVDEGSSVRNIAKGGIVECNGLSIDAKVFAHAPASLVSHADDSAISTTKDEPMDMEKLKAEYPELVTALREEGAKAERERVTAIEALGILGHDDLVKSAKADRSMTAEKLAVAVLKAENETRVKIAALREEDAQSVAGVPVAFVEGVTAPKASVPSAFIEAASRGFSKKSK